MVDEHRREPRYPVSIRIRMRYTQREQFISKFATNLSRRGMFLASRSPRPVGTQVHFELLLADDSPVIEGLGEVRWNREYDRHAPDQAYGMGIQFVEIAEHSRAVLDQAVRLRAERGDSDLDSIPRGERRGAPREGRPTPFDLEDGEELSAAPSGPPGLVADDTPDDGDDGFRGDATVAIDRHALGLGPPESIARVAPVGRALGGEGVVDAVRRARSLAARMRGVDEELAALLVRDAVPEPTVDQASAELATRRFGRAVDSSRYRAPRLDAAVTPRALAGAAIAKPPRADTIDASLHALEDEDAAGGLLDQLAEQTRADDRRMLDEIGRLRGASLPGSRAATEIPIDIDEDDIVELADEER